MARKNAATEKNILHAWQKSGLFPTESDSVIQPQVVLDNLRLKVPEPSEAEAQTQSFTMTVTASNGDSIVIPQTPANVKQVNDLVREIVAGNLDPTLPEKLGKACTSALAHNNMLRITNEDLIKADQRKKDKAARGQRHYGEARVMNLEVVEERNEAWAVKQLDKEFTQLCRLGPDIFQDSKRGRSPVRRKTTAPPISGPSMPPFTSGSIVSIQWFAPPQISLCASPDPRQRGGIRGGRGNERGNKRGSTRGIKRGSGKGSGRGSERDNATVVQEVVEEALKEVRKSRAGRTLKPKTQ
ncbi:hypothetical protein IMSHALPRED_003649 [Imshaugia aleurites]|uniref:Uncharacterized protein n=1 Tax=Imshaugia aleurites TaxID=172621 RepID=A0A8H3J2X3_9LECA|nr:hypothetical protein IMSHALPRED_001614 [Imshaugia aleurites]CAF9942380.1 hypothetical protein IMSHALPRED_003649 [Imshaugia aleurites]